MPLLASPLLGEEQLLLSAKCPETRDTTLGSAFIFLYFFKKAPKFYGFQEASEKPKRRFCTPCKARPRPTRRRQAVPAALCPRPPGTRENRTAAGGCPALNAPTRLGRGFKALVSRCSAGGTERRPEDARGPRAPGHRPRSACQAGGRPRAPGPRRGSESRRGRKRRGAVPAGPGFGAAFWLGGRPAPPSPAVQGGPGSNAHCAPSRKRPLDRGRQAGLYETNRAGGRLLTPAAGGRGAAAVSLFLVSNS